MNTQLVKIYLAGPLFTQAERQWNAALAENLRRIGYRLILPQERVQRTTVEENNFNPTLLFQHAIQSLAECDVVVAILDGADPDSGTAWECGYAYALGKKILGIRTDLRRGGDDPKNVNLMLSNCVDSMIDASSLTDDVNTLAKRVHEFLEPFGFYRITTGR
jgi:nucleoside 2-deoxyribosyltransferase